MTVGKVLPFGARGSRNYAPPCISLATERHATQRAAVMEVSLYLQKNTYLLLHRMQKPAAAKGRAVIIVYIWVF